MPDTLAEAALERALRGKTVISVAESCTGGLLSAALTQIPGSSGAFDCGFITYSNSAKSRLLGVSGDALERFGAVSEEVALQMAKGALRFSEATLAASVTGIAGPGGSGSKPEGLVCFGIASQDGRFRAETAEFGAIGRGAVRAASVDHALRLLIEAMPAP